MFCKEFAYGLVNGFMIVGTQREGQASIQSLTFKYHLNLYNGNKIGIPLFDTQRDFVAGTGFVRRTGRYDPGELREKKLPGGFFHRYAAYPFPLFGLFNAMVARDAGGFSVISRFPSVD